MDKLPRKLNKREAKVTPKIMKWFLKNWPYSVAVEVKMIDGKIKDHQNAALIEVYTNNFAYKLPDMGRRNPFDFFTLIKADAFIVYTDGTKCEAINPETKKSFVFNI